MELGKYQIIAFWVYSLFLILSILFLYIILRPWIWLPGPQYLFPKDLFYGIISN